MPQGSWWRLQLTLFGSSEQRRAAFLAWVRWSGEDGSARCAELARHGVAETQRGGPAGHGCRRGLAPSGSLLVAWASPRRGDDAAASARPAAPGCRGTRRPELEVTRLRGSDALERRGAGADGGTGRSRSGTCSREVQDTGRGGAVLQGGRGGGAGEAAPWVAAVAWKGSSAARELEAMEGGGARRKLGTDGRGRHGEQKGPAWMRRLEEAAARR